MAAAKTSALLTSLYVIGMLVFGSLNTITMKIQFSMTSTGIDGKEETFQKPWFGTLNMFFAMTLVLGAEVIVQLCNKKNKTAKSDYSLMIDGGANGGTQTPSWGKKVCMVAIPAVFDLMATALCCMGMLWIPASVWQMLRGAEIVFAAILAITCLQRTMYAFNWIGILMCVVGVSCVGVANVWGAGAEPAASAGDQSKLILGMVLVILGQVVQAAQVIAEEWLLKDVDLPELQIVGFEGFWGLLMMVLVVLPALYIIPGNDHGHVEDFADTAAMLKNSAPLLRMVLIYIFSCATYNVTGIAVTGALSAVHRTMLEASRTTVIWGFGLYVYYYVDNTSSYGEALTPYSWLQLLGFVVLMSGQAIYGEILKVPGLYYPPLPAVVEWASPGSMRLSSPLPRPSPGSAVRPACSPGGVTVMMGA